MSFVPIGLRDYVSLFLKSNRGEVKAAVIARLQSALEAYKAGARCHCGGPIWVIGSAEVGHGCFTCITGEGDPSEDYEIAEACEKSRVPTPAPVGSFPAAPDELEGNANDGVPF